MNGVPFGSAIDCPHGVAHVMSIIDLTHASLPTQSLNGQLGGLWQVDTQYTSWPLTHHDDQGNTVVRIKNLSYIYITVNGTKTSSSAIDESQSSSSSCVSTRPFTHGNHMNNINGDKSHASSSDVIVISFIAPQDLTTCQRAVSH